ncbi:MAG: hypothetical protein RLZZ563_1596, partial [Pseudomonadota bacterium]
MTSTAEQLNEIRRGSAELLIEEMGEHEQAIALLE